ncbi:3-oxoacyl-[acyl-carrier-protein] synthase-3 [Bacillus sp. 3255]|nr:3-oxoacyl-[acyl-carrier-protein] synthase-3 [Bacillus sp. 3255]
MSCYIRAIEYYLPEKEEFNDPQDRMTKKIGITSKHIAGESEFASDLAYQAALKLFNTGIDKHDIDFLLYCTQSPDYLMPTTACILQERLGISNECGAFDINLGCSGYVYGLSVAQGLILSGQAKNVLLITSDTYSKFINPKDRNVKVLFGDAAAATLVAGTETDESKFGAFVFGTDGRGAQNLIVPAGGLRVPTSTETLKENEDEFGNVRSKNNLYMNGQEIFKFAMFEVPKAVERLAVKEGRTIQDYDYYILHQANLFMLESLRKRMDIPISKFSIQLDTLGNTVSSTIPIALKKETELGKIKDGDRVLLAGFGVGYSWGACSIVWKGEKGG